MSDGQNGMSCSTFKLIPVASDGNCLFRALSVLTTGNQLSHSQIRQTIVSRLETAKDEFKEFITDEVSFLDYCAKMRIDGEWGGNLELLLASRIFKATILVFQGDKPSLQILDPQLKGVTERTLHLSYDSHRHYSPLLPDAGRTGNEAQENPSQQPLNRLQEAMKVVQDATNCSDGVLLYNVVTSLDGDIVRSIKIIVAELKRRKEVKETPKPQPDACPDTTSDDEEASVSPSKRRVRLSFPKLRLLSRYHAQRVN